MKFLLLLMSLNASGISLIEKKPEIIRQKSTNKNLLREQLEYYKNKANTYKKLSEVKRNNFDLHDDFKEFRSGDMIKGHLFNFVLSTNLNTPIIVIPESDKLPKESKILCEGRVFRKRVAAECSKIVTPSSEIEINAILLSEDGSYGLVGEYKDGRDYELANNVVQGTMTNILEGQRDLINTEIGIRSKRTSKNLILDGFFGGLSNQNEQKNSSNLASVFIEKKTKTLLYFK